MRPESVTDLTLEGLVHDLNNVFETISEAADLLESDPKWAKVAGAIHRSVSRGQRIVGSYSASTRAEQEFGAILETSIEFARDLLAAVRAPAVEFVCEPGTQVVGSTASWERVLLNLFMNAAQAMKQGGVISITASRKGNETEICVADSGPGIPPEILPQIFEPHFSTKSASPGLGLHIVKSLVSQNGGSVSARNRTDASGAAFHIRIPFPLH